jgi:ribonuclease T2
MTRPAARSVDAAPPGPRVAALLGLAPAASAQDRPGNFSFYVLALSWSPSWCETAEAADESRQCRPGSRHGFVVHGLWPQYERGYPEFCGGERPERVPASWLMRWPTSCRTGGSSSRLAQARHLHGVSADQYLDETRAALERITIPDTSLPRGRIGSYRHKRPKRIHRRKSELDADEIAVACTTAC